MSDERTPLWNYERIDEEMAREYKAHGDTYQFIWVRHLLRVMAQEYEAALAELRQEVEQVRQPQVAEWEPVPDGLYEQENKIDIRVMGHCLWQKDNIFGREDKVFLPSGWRLMRLRAGEGENER